MDSGSVPVTTVSAEVEAQSQKLSILCCHRHVSLILDASDKFDRHEVADLNTTK